MIQRTFKSKSATRVDLAGGTLDLWPLSALVPNASTVNCSISCYTSVIFEQGHEMTIFVQSPDFKENFKFLGLNSFLKTKDIKLSLLQEAFSVLDNKKNGVGKWHIKSESPTGSGLGGSSSLLISILKVLFSVNKEDYTEKSIVEAARNIESKVLQTPAGIQDYFSPIKKGFNFIEYKTSGFIRSDMSKSLSYWKDCITIVDSQIKHHSGINNWNILKEYIDKDLKVENSLNKIARISIETKKAVESKNLSELSKCFKQELLARKEVSKFYVSSKLNVFLEYLMTIDKVLSLKICGAGGGGCVLVLHDPRDKKIVQESLLNKKILVLPFQLIGS